MAPPTTATDSFWFVLSDADTLSAALRALDQPAVIHIVIALAVRVLWYTVILGH